MKTHLTLSLLVTIAAGSASPASALEPEYVAETPLVDPSERPDGWTHAVDLASGLQLSGSSSVVGQPDGPTTTLSLSFAYTGEMWRGHHELRTTVSLVEAVSRTPLVDDFVKSSDSLFAQSIYYYHLPAAPWLGPFVRASGRTSLFEGINVQPDEVTYLRDGESIVADRLKLTNSFGPTYLKQSVGLFARPVQEEAVALDLRLGIGARETFADGNFALADDEDTPEIEVATLQSYNQAGGEFAVEIYGAGMDATVNYGAGFEMLVPFYDSIDEDLDPVDATNYEVTAHFGAQLNSWASVRYELSMLKVPQIVDDWQVANQLLLSFNYARTWGVGAE